jgi:uncharacterized protein with NRDE domain
MCLVLFAWKAHPDYRLLLAANRDELHARPTREMHWWPDAPALLAGRDLQAGGSWFAIAKNGRFAIVTNYRETRGRSSAKRSRGELVRNFVEGSEDPLTFGADLDGHQYGGFSLLAGDNDELVYWSNRGDEPRVLPAGVYGLSNASLDTPWPKLLRCREKLNDAIVKNDLSLTSLSRILADKEPAPASQIETGGLSFDVARALSAPFIVTPEYGTRCSTSLLIGNNGHVEVSERRFDPAGNPSGDSVFRFSVQ